MQRVRERCAACVVRGLCAAAHRLGSISLCQTRISAFACYTSPRYYSFDGGDAGVVASQFLDGFIDVMGTDTIRPMSMGNMRNVVVRKHLDHAARCVKTCCCHCPTPFTVPCARMHPPLICRSLCSLLNPRSSRRLVNQVPNSRLTDRKADLIQQGKLETCAIIGNRCGSCSTVDLPPSASFGGSYQAALSSILLCCAAATSRRPPTEQTSTGSTSSPEETRPRSR